MQLQGTQRITLLAPKGVERNCIQVQQPKQGDLWIHDKELYLYTLYEKYNELIIIEHFKQQCARH